VPAVLGKIPDKVHLLDPVSWNRRFSNRQLKFLILSGYGLFFGLSWLRRPWRLPALVYRVAFGAKTTTKSQRILKDTLRTVGLLRAAPRPAVGGDA
jgi:hypothetical protein